MKKLTVLYKTPKNIVSFMKHYTQVHRPLVDQIPGLEKVEITKVDETLIGAEECLLKADLYFEANTLEAAMNSPEKSAADADLEVFAEGALATIMVGDAI